MYLNSSPAWLRGLHPGGLTWEIEPCGKEIFLTFDDGPVPEVTPWVLDLLKSFNIQATFFCVGENIDRYSELFQRLLAGGHQVGNHTYHHLKAWKSKKNAYLADVEMCAKLVGNHLFRPPHGQINFSLARSLRKDYRIVMWTALSGDFDRKISAEQCLENARKHTRPGAIVVFHDSLKAFPNLEYALPRYLDNCLNQGYSFSKLKE